MYQRGVSFALETLLQEIFENYLGVTPIRSGDSVIIIRSCILFSTASKKRLFAYAISKKGGTAAKNFSSSLVISTSHRGRAIFFSDTFLYILQKGTNTL